MIEGAGRERFSAVLEKGAIAAEGDERLSKKRVLRRFVPADYCGGGEM